MNNLRMMSQGHFRQSLNYHTRVRMCHYYANEGLTNLDCDDMIIDWQSLKHSSPIPHLERT